VIAYATSLLLLAAAVLALSVGGPATWLLPIVSFVLIPAAEQLSRGSTRNLSQEAEAQVLQNPWYDRLLYAVVPGQYALLLTWLVGATSGRYQGFELIGAGLTAGIGCGVFGINVAHELGHRRDPTERTLAKALLLTSLYQHFFIEHNRGHHVRVATPDDPATSRRGESVYAFWFRSVLGGVQSAWNLERRRLEGAGQAVWSWENEMVRMLLTQAGALLAVTLYFGPVGLVAWLVAATIGVLLLETVNYVEHYGLQREALDGGRFGRVQPAHSWNSNRTLGRILLFELTRHADHHANAQRPYPVLRHFDDGPQLPGGYPAMILLSFVPALWFRVMDNALDGWLRREPAAN
jgi:alkane 1-monooxygenase